MIFKTESKRLQIKGFSSQSVKVSEELDLVQFYQDLQANGFTIEQEVFEHFLLNVLDRNAQTNSKLVLVPGIYKAGAIAAFNSDSRSFEALSYSRKSPARFIDKRGKLQLCQADVPRIGYDVLFKNCKGYQMEPGSVNLLPFSHGNIAPGSAGLSITDEFAEWGDTLYKQRGISQAKTSHVGILQPGCSYAYSAYLQIEDGHKPNKDHFRLQVAGQMQVQYEIAYICQGIYRLYAHFDIQEAPRVNSISMEITETLADRQVHVLGEQLEFGQEATSYIKTDGNVQVRMSDTIGVSKEFPQAAALLSSAKAKSYFINQLVVFDQSDDDYIKTQL